MGQFVYIICNSSYGHHTEASRLFISKFGAQSATWVRKLVGKQKSTNLNLFLHDCDRIHYQIDCIGPFVHTICNSFYS